MLTRFFGPTWKHARMIRSEKREEEETRKQERPKNAETKEVKAAETSHRT